MPILHIVLVALVQGITEFLPISSSGHLILLPKLTGLADQGLVIDVAVHVGTLGAVLLYFRNDVARAVRGLLRLNDHSDPDSRLALGLVVATIPVVIAGLLLSLSGYEESLRSIAVVGWMTLIFGLVLYWADRTGAEDKSAEQWNLGDALTMGLAQVIALVPGTSRSGITITAARKLGYSRSDAARLSMLMSIPTIFASGSLIGFDVVSSMDGAAARDAAIAALLSFGAALLALHFMMRLLRTVSFTPYVIYRVVLGVVLLAIAYA